MKSLCILLVMLCLLSSQTMAADRKPNIIVILADDLGIPGLGCTGGIYKTPNLDALGAGGIRFENCFASPLCGPSRAMLLTGRYAPRTGMKRNGDGKEVTPEKDGCVAQLMKQAGYVTAVAGKWQHFRYLSNQEESSKWGFDEFLLWGAGEAEEGDGKASKAKVDASGEKQKKLRYWDPVYNLNGKTLEDTKGKYGPDLLNEYVCDFIRRNQDKPFFIYYPTPLIHSPLRPTPDSPQPGAGKPKGKEYSVYGQNITYLDKLVGQLVAELDRLKLRGNTLIVFTGDNGSEPVGTVNGRPIDGNKGSMQEGGSRVPLIANWPGTAPAGRVLGDLTDFSDFLPTFAALAGASLPADRKIDGRSFAPQLRGGKGEPRDWVYVQLDENRYVRSARWKLTGDGNLFDMKDAPYSQIPVPAGSNSSEAAAERAKLQAVLDNLVPQGATDTTKRARKKVPK